MQHVQASRAYWQPMPSRLDFYSKHELQPTALSWCTTTRPWQLTTLPWCQQLGDSAYARRNNEQLLGCYANYSAAHSTTWLHIRLLGCTFDYLAAPTDYLAAVNDNPAVVIDYSAAAATNQAKSCLIFYIFQILFIYVSGKTQKSSCKQT